MMITYYLALVLLLNHEAAPKPIRGFSDTNISTAKEQCEIEAEKENHTNPIVRDPDVRAAGGEFVCLKVERIHV